MHQIKIQDIMNCVTGYCKNIVDENLKVLNVKINDKEVEKNSVFIAIVGKNFDGHSFIKNAIKNGACLIITEKEFENIPQIVVKNTKTAFLEIASLNRSLFKGDLVGITGSAGKTTTKDMLAEILNSHFKTLKTIGNLNNEIGLSKTILNLNSSFKAAVVEMGMSNLGEIKILSKTCKPSIGIITNIGSSHIEFLKTKKNILKSKLEILAGMNKNSYLILNGDDRYLKNVKLKNYNVIFCGIKNKDSLYYAKNLKQVKMSTKFNLFKKGEFISEIVIPTIGEHNVLNSLLAIAAADILKIKFNNIKTALKNFQPSGMRQKIYNFNGIIVVADFYNANPESVKAAIKSLKKIPSKGRKIAVLGSMLELGTYSKKAHIKIGEFVVKNNVDFLICFGEQAKEIFNGAIHLAKSSPTNLICKYFTEKLKLIDFIKKTLKKDDAILLKASRYVKFEDVFKSVFCNN